VQENIKSVPSVIGFHENGITAETSDIPSAEGFFRKVHNRACFCYIEIHFFD
jgi:hypothetical protein